MKTKKQKTAFRTVRVIPRIRFATRVGESNEQPQNVKDNK